MTRMAQAHIRHDQMHFLGHLKPHILARISTGRKIRLDRLIQIHIQMQATHLELIIALEPLRDHTQPLLVHQAHQRHRQIVLAQIDQLALRMIPVHDQKVEKHQAPQIPL